jgi:hypothetical protein
MSKQLMDLFQSPMDLDPVYFIQKYRTVLGDPFVIEGEGRDYLKELYRYCCVGMLRDKKRVVILKGRQVEMTEAALNIGLYFLCNYKYFRVLHAFPRNAQVSRFSRERLQGAIRDSKKDANDTPMLLRFLADHANAANTVSAVEFKNSNFYYLYSAWAEADALRGISADALLRDEFQDWSDDAIANTDSSLSVSKYQIEFSFGTPKYAGTPFDKLWDFTDQRYFHTKCSGCGNYFMITLDTFVHGYMVRCPKCHKENDKRKSNVEGKWIPTKAVGKDGRVGFHISQLIHPNISREDITRKQKEYSEARFKNEVMGEFYTGAALPLTEKEIIDRCCVPYKELSMPHMIVPPKETFMGIDWGGRSDVNDKGAFTVVTIISKQGDQYKVERVERVTYPDYGKQVRYISDLIKLYNCVSVVADIGAGQVQCQMLQNEHGDKVKSCYYAANLQKKLSYKDDIWMLSVDRDGFLEEIIDIITKGNLIIPWKDPNKADWFIRHLCNTEVQTYTRTGNYKRKFEKLNKSKPNDGLHSLNYAYIASIVHLGENVFGRNAITSQYQQDLPKMIGASFNGRPAGMKMFGSLPTITRSSHRR